MPCFNSVEHCQQIVARDLNAIPDEFKNFDDETRNDRSKNPWKRIVVGIVTCKKYGRRLKSFLTIFADIFADLGLDYYILNADSDIETEDGHDYVVDHESRVFTAKAKESYETLAHKLAIFYSYIANETDYDYIVKADDGCLLNLKEVISRLDKPYVGASLKGTNNRIHINKCTDKKCNVPLDFGHEFKRYDPEMDDEKYKKLKQVYYGGGGYGYRMSRDAFQHIEKYKEHVLSLPLTYEDMIFGQILHLEGINVVRMSIGRYHYIGPRQ
jgi:hypothetical protein